MGLVDRLPLGLGWNDVGSLQRQHDGPETVECSCRSGRRTSVSPGYFHAAGTTLLAGRTFTWHDDKNSPRVAIVNREFARKVFGSERGPQWADISRQMDGTRIQVVGIVEDGKIQDPHGRSAAGGVSADPAVAVEFDLAGGALESRPAATGRRPCERNLRNLDAGLPFTIKTWNKRTGQRSVCLTRSDGVAGGAGRIGRDAGGNRNLRHGLLLGEQTAAGAGHPHRAGRAAQGSAGGGAGAGFRLLAFGSVAGLLLGMAATKVLSFIVYQATPRDPLVLAGVVLTMLLLGLLAAWIPAQRALGADPLILLREE